MGNPLGVYETNYKVKYVKNLSFRLAPSRVILLYSITNFKSSNPFIILKLNFLFSNFQENNVILNEDKKAKEEKYV